MQLPARHVAMFALAPLLCIAPAVSKSAPLAGDTFVLDPGHGARFADGSALNVGAVGPHGVQEQVVTLDVGEKLARLLRADGARVVLT
ncbi:MAG: N-acetylmuramoyl-L-alanine amidase, partial [Candidatus Eremiobacteraeota bacterium]|nr:N-acetylmuramoyl-L-alanine amidase [Candidatus Eremiobacteraeota bacterium]